MQSHITIVLVSINFPLYTNTSQCFIYTQGRSLVYLLSFYWIAAVMQINTSWGFFHPDLFQQWYLSGLNNVRAYFYFFFIFETPLHYEIFIRF